MEPSLRTLVVDPSAFFQDGPGSIRHAVGKVLFVGVVGLGTFPVLLRLLRAPEIPEDVLLDAFPPLRYAVGGDVLSFPGFFVLVIASTVAFPLAVWLAYGAVFHLVSAPVASRGGFARTLSAIAPGFLPQAVGSFVVLGTLAFVFPATATELWTVGMTLPARIHAAPADPTLPFLLANGIATLCTIWSGLLWTEGLAVARGIDRRTAAAVVVVPVLLSILGTLPAVRLFDAVGPLLLA